MESNITSRLTKLVVVGCAAKLDWVRLLRNECIGFLKTGLLLQWMSWACFGLTLAPIVQLACAPERIQGEWVDQSLSDVFTERLGSPTRVRDVHFLGWTTIGFGRLEIRRHDGSLMVSAQSGKIALKSFSLQKNGFFETEVVLRGAQMTRTYYRNARPQSLLSRWMRHPLSMNHLTARIRQNHSRTRVRIVECLSRDMRMGGEIIFENTGAVKDGLKISMSPLRFLAATV